MRDTENAKADACFRYIAERFKGRQVEWNFEKYLLDSEGRPFYGCDCYKPASSLESKIKQGFEKAE